MSGDLTELERAQSSYPVALEESMGREVLAVEANARYDISRGWRRTEGDGSAGGSRRAGTITEFLLISPKLWTEGAGILKISNYSLTILTQEFSSDRLDLVDSGCRNARLTVRDRLV